MIQDDNFKLRQRTGIKTAANETEVFFEVPSQPTEDLRRNEASLSATDCIRKDKRTVKILDNILSNQHQRQYPSTVPCSAQLDGISGIEPSGKHILSSSTADHGTYFGIGTMAAHAQCPLHC